jgi:hydrogenase maturation protease
MSVKLIAMGNVLMKDDAVGLEVAKVLEERLIEKNIEVIYAETDFQYCFSKVLAEDFIIILDAACLGKSPGEITVMPLEGYVPNRKNSTQHNYSFLDLLKLYYDKVSGMVIAIEVKEVEFDFGLSLELQEKLKGISEQVLNIIEDTVEEDFDEVI